MSARGLLMQRGQRMQHGQHKGKGCEVITARNGTLAMSLWVISLSHESSSWRPRGRAVTLISAGQWKKRMGGEGRGRSRHGHTSCKRREHRSGRCCFCARICAIRFRRRRRSCRQVPQSMYPLLCECIAVAAEGCIHKNNAKSAIISTAPSSQSSLNPSRFSNSKTGFGSLVTTGTF